MKREDQIEEEIKSLIEERELLRGRKTLGCDHCGKRTQIKKWIVIDNYHYIQPSGCSGGDYWVNSKDYNLVCPKCDRVGRVYLPSWVHWHTERGEPVETHNWYENDKDRINTYNFVHGHLRYFGEKLGSYEEGIEVDVLRKIKKEKEEKSNYY